MMGRARDLNSREELHRMLPAQSSVADFSKYCDRSNSPSDSSSISSAGDNALWNEDFSHRPSWCDAGMVYQQMKKGRADGNKCAIRLRALLQRLLFRLGCFIQHHFAIAIFVGLLILIICSFGMWNATVETNMEKLWVEKGGRLDRERDFIRRVFSEQARAGGALVDDGGLTGGGNSAQYLVLIQTPKQEGLDILNEEELLLHTEALKNVSQLTVDMFGEKWRLSDICFKPAAPAIESSFGDIVKTLLDRIIPCVIITPLDCFFEGSVPLGPFPPMNVPADVTFFIPSLKGRLTWKNLNPLQVVEDASSMIGGADGIKALFARAGVEDGYLSRPCIDRLDPECPPTAPNYLDICVVVEKYLDSTNRSYAPTTTTTTKRPTVLPTTVAALDGNSTAAPTKNGTTPADHQQEAKVLNLFWPSTDEEKPRSNSKLPPAICNRYADEVRHLVRTDRTLLSRLGLDEKMNFAQELSGGCKGFAHNYMQWPEDLIVGGVQRKSGRIVKAEALQTVLMISSAADVFHRFKEQGSYKSRLHLDKWTPEAADDVLKAWQRKYTDYIYKSVNNTEGERRLHPLAGTSVNDMMAEFSKFNPTVILVGYVLMIGYAAVSLCSCAERGVRSSVGLAIAGCLLVTLASVAGLGLSMWMGVKFNAATTQIVPFLTLGLGVDDMFLLVHNYREIVKFVNRDEIGFLLKETGLSALLTSMNNIVAFLAGSLMPVPALRDFCLQVAILLCFNAVTILTIFPAMMKIDLDRRKQKRVDIFCCVTIKNDRIQPKTTSVDVGTAAEMNTAEYDNVADLSRRTTDNNNENNSMESALSQSTNSILGNGGGNDYRGKLGIGNLVSSSDRQRLSPHRKGLSNSLKHKCKHWTLHRFVKDVYIPLLCKRRVKVGVLVFHLILCAVGILGVSRVQLGLELTDVIPKDTAPYAFLDAREAYFSFYPFNVIMQGPTDYARKQRLVRDFREEIANISYVVKNNDRRLTEDSWVSMMAKWLGTLQIKLDDDMYQGHINLSGLVRSSASAEGRLAYKLLCNRGDTVNCSRVGTTKLVDRDGMIEPEGFYNYLTAWYNMDPMTYYISQANFYPIPPPWHDTEHMKDEIDFKVPPAGEIVYSQIPFFANHLVDTTATVDMIWQVRQVCDRYEALGLPVFPEGIPFTFWEQYLHLVKNLLSSLGLITGAVFIIVTILLMNPWMALIIVGVLVLMVVELAGFMGLVGLKLNPVSSVTLITAVGIGVEFTVHISLSFLTALGTRNERMRHTLEHMFIPVLHGGMSTLLGVIMLAFSEFEFVVRYFFMVMSALIVLGLLNGLILLPVVLSLIGPKPEVRPTDGTNRLAPPTPPPRRPPVAIIASVTTAGNNNNSTPIFPRHRCGSVGFTHGPGSLSTIAEMGEETSPPASATPPVTSGSDGTGGQAIITVDGMKVLVHGGTKMDSPMTLTAKSKVQVQMVPGHQPASADGSNVGKNNRRSTIAACDAPPPYSSKKNNNNNYNQQVRESPIENGDTDGGDGGGNRRRNRSAGSAPCTPSSSSVSSPNNNNGHQRRSFLPCQLPSPVINNNGYSPLHQAQPMTRRRIPSDPSAHIYDNPSDIMRF